MLHHSLSLLRVSEPISLGFVTSLSHPGGNVTGFSNLEPKRRQKMARVAESHCSADYARGVFMTATSQVIGCPLAEARPRRRVNPRGQRVHQQDRSAPFKAKLFLKNITLAAQVAVYPDHRE